MARRTRILLAIATMLALAAMYLVRSGAWWPPYARARFGEPLRIARDFLAATEPSDTAVLRALSAGSQPIAWVSTANRLAPALLESARRDAELDFASQTPGRDTIRIEFVVPYRSMEAFCYGPAGTDHLQMMLARSGSGWRVTYVGLVEC